LSGIPQTLFDVRVHTNELPSYTVTPDGERFLVNTMVSDTSQPLVVVLSWRAGLKK
jgi:hypothetical protein